MFCSPFLLYLQRCMYQHILLLLREALRLNTLQMANTDSTYNGFPQIRCKSCARLSRICVKEEEDALYYTLTLSHRFAG